MVTGLHVTKKFTAWVKGFSAQWLQCGSLIAPFLLVSTEETAAETRYICWLGANGYSMTGKMEYPDDRRSSSVIVESDIVRFNIRGFLDGQPIGNWSLSELDARTSWRLHYDPQKHVFLLSGSGGLYQMWNANGRVNDCGDPGFGFNAGNGGQDLCVNGVFMTDSTIDPDTPLVGYPTARTNDCIGTPLLGKSSQ